MQLNNLTKLVLIGATALAFTACGGGDSGGGGGSSRQCSTTLQYLDSTYGTGRYTGVRVYNNSSIIINNMTIESSFPEEPKIVDPGDSYYFRIKSYIGEGALKVLDEEGCIHEMKNVVRQGYRNKYELVDKI